MNGWEFLEAYENIKPWLTKNIPIHIMTSFGDGSDIHKSLQFDTVKGFMVKPVTKEGFSRILSGIP